MDIAFFLGSVVTIVCAGSVVTRRDPIDGALSLLGFFLGIAGLFVLLSAGFVAVVHLLVTGISVLVLFRFVIVLIDDEERGGRSRGSRGEPIVSLLLAAGLFVALAAVFFRERGFERVRPEALRDGAYGSTSTVAEHLLLRSPLAIEAVGLLVVVALVGAVVVSRRGRRS